MKKDYNGWTNRETWLFNLWHGDYFYALTEDGETVTPEQLEEFHDDAVADVPNGYARDLLAHDINFYELAEIYNNA